MLPPPVALAPTVLLALGATPPAQEPPAPPEVPVRLVADLATVAPGAELEVGVHLRVPAGWHVYWANPGETGMATSARLELPEGFEVEGPRFPGPVRHEDPGGIVSFVHEGDLVLFFRVRAPLELPEGPLRLGAEVRWLVCRDVCFVGTAEPELELATGAETAPAPAETLRLLEAQRTRLPRPLADLDGEARLEWLDVPVPEGERARLAFRLELAGTEGIEFFEAPESPLEVVRQAQERSGPWRRLALELARRPGTGTEPARVRGVLRLEKGGTVAYFALDATRPTTPPGDR